MSPFSKRAATVVCFVLAGRALGNDQPGWLNARDCGASGSTFQTTATTTAGSTQITVAEVGDLKPGQGVMVSRCNPHFPRPRTADHARCVQPFDNTIWGPHEKPAASRPLQGEIEVRGYDGTAGSWVTYILDVAPGSPSRYRWTDDLGQHWKPAQPITYDWQPLSGGVEVRFRPFDWQRGYSVAIVGRDQLRSTIERIDGNVLTLRDAAARTATDAIVRHDDTAALQAAVDRALKEKKNLLIPVGNYRLAEGIVVKGAAAITIEGQSAVDTVLDISEGEGSCITLEGGTEATLRNLLMRGHMGFDQRDQAGLLETEGGTSLWGFFFKICSAVYIDGTERVLVENCHARRMSMESFYSSGPGRSATHEPKSYTKAITYLRCSVEDCARNAFNNNDEAENTSVLNCRIRDVGGCSWEGASRFVRFTGNYVRNAGTVAMGNIRSRDVQFEQLGAGQHIIADNVFESLCPYGGCMIRASAGASQVIIRNNLFVNFNSSAVHISGDTEPSDLPASNALVTGNLFDMTAIGQQPQARIAIDLSASDVILGDNQIYVRGGCDRSLTGIRLRDDAMNLNLHDNLVRNCGTGVIAGRVRGTVAEVVDTTTFLTSPVSVPLLRRDSHRYRGWNVVWLKNEQAVGRSIIEAFDPETLRFKLRAPRTISGGDAFEVFPSAGANWNLHDNTITGCLRPIVLDAYGSETSLVKDNLVSRGEVAGVERAVLVRGRFDLVDNHFLGFDEPGCAVLELGPGRFGKPPANLYRGNVFERCTAALAEGGEPCWNAAHVDGNVYRACGRAPSQATDRQQP
jgi:hypothetical protein